MGVLGWVADSYIIYSSDNGAPPASADVNHQVGTLPGWIARTTPTAAVALVALSHTRAPRPD